MLQAVHNDHDPHYEWQRANSVSSLATAQNDGKIHLLLTASGSVATIKIPVIVKALEKYHNKLSIRVVLTQSAKNFLAGQSAEQPTVKDLLHLPGVDAVYDDACEWAEPWRRGANILHIELRRWADLMVIAPLSANTLAKIVNGISDSLLTSVVRAWDTDGSIDGRRKRIIVCPAMNSAMWHHPITAKQMRVISEDWGCRTSESGEPTGWMEVIPPIVKSLACGDKGDGGMATYDTIVKVIEERLGLVLPLEEAV